MLACTLGGSLGLSKLPIVQNGLQDSRGICLLVEILNDLVCLPSSRFRYVLNGYCLSRRGPAGTVGVPKPSLVGLDFGQRLRLLEPITSELVADRPIRVLWSGEYGNGSDTRTLGKHSIYRSAANGIEWRGPFPSLFICLSGPAYGSVGLVRRFLHTEVVIPELADSRNAPSGCVGKVQNLTQIAWFWLVRHSSAHSDKKTPSPIARASARRTRARLLRSLSVAKATLTR